MDILIAGDTLPENPWYRDRIPAMINALEGYNSEIIDIYAFTLTEKAHNIHKTHKSHNYFHRDRPDLIELNKKFHDRIMSYNPRILILGTVDNYGQFLLMETVESLQKNNVKVVGIMGDDEFNHSINKWYIPVFDYSIAYVKKIRDYYASIKDTCYFLPNSCFFPVKDFDELQIPEEDKQHEVLFMGAPFGIRPDLIRALINSGVKVSLYGSKEWSKYPEFTPFYHGYAPHDEIPQIIRNSKIYLSLLEDHLTGELHMNTKIWDAVKYGQFTIITYYKPLMEDYGLEEGKELVMYKSIEDLVEKVNFYLNNSQDRINMARNLYDKIYANFNYEDLYREIFNDLNINEIQPGSTSSHSLTIVNLIEDNYSNGEAHVIDLDKKYWKKEILRALQNDDHPYVIIRSKPFEYTQSLDKFEEVLKQVFDRADFKALYLRELSNGKLAYKRNRMVCLSNILWERQFLLDNFSSFNLKNEYLLIEEPLEETKIPFCRSQKSSLWKRIFNKIDQKIHYRS